MKPQADFPHFDAQTAGSQGNAILGIRDSGKSYTAIEIAERFFDAGVPWVALDPSGRWRFIRVPGHGKGYPVVVSGGQAGDLPLTVEGAPALVRAAMESGISLVLDLYDVNISKADWKRIVADVVRVLFFENAPHGLRHIFIEEAAEFCPQRIGPDQGRVYSEIERLARMGGNARLGYTLINQRAEEVNKAVLELCDNLYLHRQKGRNSLTALTKWLDVADVKPGGREIIQSLPTLPQGECWAWMAGTDRPVLVKVPAKNSAEPDRRAMRGDVVAHSKPAVDVTSFIQQMRAALAGEKPKATQPRKTIIQEDPDVKESEARALRAENETLKARLRELEQQLSLPPMTAPAALDMDAIYAEVKRRAQNDAALLRVLMEKPEIEVSISRRVLTADHAKQPGLLAWLIAEGFFDEPVQGAAVVAELKRRGRAVHNANVYRDLNNLAEQGFLTVEAGGFRVAPGAKVSIVEARAA